MCQIFIIFLFLMILYTSFPLYLVIWLSGFPRFSFSPMATRGPKKNPGFPKPFFSDSIFLRDRDFKFPRFPGILPPRFLVFCFPSLSGYLIIWISSFFFFPPWLLGVPKKSWFPESLFSGFNFFRDRDRDFKFPRYPSSSIPPLRVSSGFRIWKSF